jgi:secondary thiamine-phosphate synthase enzyme
LPGVATYSGELHLKTAGDGDTIDVTEGVERIVGQSGVTEGAVTVFAPGSTAAITTMEFERGGVQDLKAALDRLIPPQGDYEHNRLNHDTNSHAHMRAAVVGPSETVPLRDGTLRLGIWQQIVLLDFDDRPRDRTVVVTVTS